jgi:hypothetical protein
MDLALVLAVLLVLINQYHTGECSRALWGAGQLVRVWINHWHPVWSCSAQVFRILQRVLASWAVSAAE